MPFATVKLRPGINVEYTPVLNEAGYSESQLGRFKAGLFQKIGGWELYYPFNISGIPKALHPWQDLNTNKQLMVGSTNTLGVIEGGTLNTITPQAKTTNFTPSFTSSSSTDLVTVTDSNISNVSTYDSIYFNTPISIGGTVLFGLYPIKVSISSTSFTIDPGKALTTDAGPGLLPQFTTVNGSATVTVVFPNHGLSVGDTIDFPIATSVGGVSISGSYTAVTVSSVDEFTIVANSVATSSATSFMNGGDCQLVYYITLGPAAAGSGYGVGGYGEGGYGTGTTSTVQTGSPIASANWSLDNFGQLGIAVPKDGGLYYYDPNGGFETAIFVPEAPIFNGGAFVAMPQQQIIAWGSTTDLVSSSGVKVGEVQDPLLVRWCDVGDFFTWEAATTNQAGSYRIPTGSLIVGGRQGAQNGLLWTDLDLWAMSYLGQPLVYGFNKIGSNCGLIAQNAHTQLLGNVYWMGQSNFFMMAGNGIQTIPCTVWDAVFQDLDTANQHKCIAGANTPFNEVWWFYPSLSGGTGECDKYVKYNTVEETWDYGTLSRSCWVDQSVIGPPLAASPEGLIYQHEKTNDAAGSPINSVMQTGYWMLAEGEEVVFVDWILPDFKWGFYNGDQDAQIQVTVYATDYPGDIPRIYGPYTVNRSSQYINTRIRARYMALNVQSSDTGSFWRLGGVKYRYAQDGRR